MFKHFFKKLNAIQTKDQAPELKAGTATYEELYQAVILSRDESSLPKSALTGGKFGSDDRTILLPASVEMVETEMFLQLNGPALGLQQISDEIQSMEFLLPGDQILLGEWKFLVTDGSVMSCRDERFIALPPDEWLMMGCKFNDAISGYDTNPYTFYHSPFGNYKLPYGIEIYITDLPKDESQ